MVVRVLYTIYHVPNHVLSRRSFVRLYVAMETVVSSSNDESVDDEVDEQEHETSQTTSTLRSAADNFCENLSRKKHQPCSVVWKFFSTLQGRKSVQRQLCPTGNKDGILAYHRGPSSMREHLKRRHYTTFCESTMNDSSGTPSASKQTRLQHYS